MLAGLVQHFCAAILHAWQLTVTAQLAERKGFRGVEFADIKGSVQLLISNHQRERENVVKSHFVWDVWNGFLLGHAKKEDAPCRFCGGKDSDGHLFWECTFPPFQHVGELTEFMTLMKRDRSKWPRCLLWHGWLPVLSNSGERQSLGCVIRPAG